MICINFLFLKIINFSIHPQYNLIKRIINKLFSNNEIYWRDDKIDSSVEKILNLIYYNLYK